jgi:fucose 4-O-acetylase-like acetyltransferase
MGPIRLILFFVWAAVAYRLVARHEAAINRRTKGILVMLGQNSLFVYVYHAFIVFAFKFFIPLKTSIAENFLIVTAALILLICGTYLYTRFRGVKPQISNKLISLLPKRNRSAAETA